MASSSKAFSWVSEYPEISCNEGERSERDIVNQLILRLYATAASILLIISSFLPIRLVMVVVIGCQPSNPPNDDCLYTSVLLLLLLMSSSLLFG